MMHDSPGNVARQYCGQLEKTEVKHTVAVCPLAVPVIGTQSLGNPVHCRVQTGRAFCCLIADVCREVSRYCLRIEA